MNNETKNWDVYFDNLGVTHYTGPLTEETHYYPFGLTMAGISSKAIGRIENKNKFNGIEQNTDLDLNMYDAFYRNLDPQVGRWWQLDPKPTDGESLYAAMNGNPVLRNDALGDTSVLGQLWRGSKFGVQTTIEGAAAQAASMPRKFLASGGNPLMTLIPDGEDIINAFKGGLELGKHLGDVTKNEEHGWAYTAGFIGEKVLEAIILKKVVGAGTAGTAVTEGAMASETENVKIYRGINENHPGFSDALNGTAKPRGGTATAAEHNAGNTLSPFTSWTTNPEVATNYALRPNGSGVVLEATVPRSSTIVSPSLKNVNLKQWPGTIVNESEVLMRGPVNGAQVRPRP